jgi:phage terminase Nu1 subunit (DNA packaging protein)
MTGIIIAIIIVILYILLINSGWFLYSKSYLNLNRQLRSLWLEHVDLTREYVLLSIEGVDTRQYTSSQLMKNQDKIGAIFGKYYTKCIGDQIATLLKTHITIAVKLLDDLKANSPEVVTVNKQWYANADDIAAFLHSINQVFWPESALKAMLYKHLDLTKNEISKYLNAHSGHNEDKGLDMPEYMEIREQALMMANAMTDGISAQYRWRFII